MNRIISGNMVGGAAPLRTLIIQDSDGIEYLGVVTGNEVVFTANDEDVVEGKTYASDMGLSTGTQEVAPYIYALIDDAGLCHEVRGTSKNYDGTEGYVIISKYDSDYISKYYNKNNGRWYFEASFVTEFMSI